MSARYCRCAGDPYSLGVNWDVWVTDPDRAWCRTCGLDLTPEDVGRTYAVGMAELERIRDKFPEMVT